MANSNTEGPVFAGTGRNQGKGPLWWAMCYQRGASAGLSIDTLDFLTAQRGELTIPNIFGRDCVPAAAAVNNLVTAATGTGGTPLVLKTTTGAVTTVVINGVTRYRLDIPRCLRLTSAGNDSAVSFTISGFDEYGVAMTQTLVGANAGNVITKKAFWDIVSITPATTPAGTVAVGSTDVVGLPQAVSGFWQVVGNSTWDSRNSALVVGGFTAADTTSPATAATGDVRGTITLPSASDGTKSLQIILLCPNISGTTAQTFGVTQA